MNFEGAYPRKQPEPKKQSQVLQYVLVLLIFMMLAALLVPNVNSGHGDSKVSVAKSDIATFSGLVDQFRLDCGRYPTTAEGLDVLRVRRKQTFGWAGPYTNKEIPTDPWGNPYHYTSPGPNGGGYQIESYGADGQPLGDGDNADIIGGSDE